MDISQTQINQFSILRSVDFDSMDWHQVYGNMWTSFGRVKHTKYYPSCRKISVSVSLTWISNEVKIKMKSLLSVEQRLHNDSHHTQSIGQWPCGTPLFDPYNLILPSNTQHSPSKSADNWIQNTTKRFFRSCPANGLEGWRYIYCYQPYALVFYQAIFKSKAIHKCSKYGFYIIMSEGIIDLHHILFYLYKCHEQTCCHGSVWVYVMTADQNHVSRWSPLIGPARQRFPRANWCGRPRGWLSWAGDFRANGCVFVM